MSSNIHTLVLIHGWGFNKNIWQFNLDYLESKYNIITIELNGHGDTSFNHDYNNIDQYLDSLIHQVPVGSHILGWSLGGIIALNLKYKFHNHIDKIILCCSNPCFLNNHNWQYGVDVEIWNKFSNNLISDPYRTIKNFLLLQTLDHPESKKLFNNLLNILNLAHLPSIEGLKWGLDILQQDYRHILNQIKQTDISFILGLKDNLVNKKLALWLKQHFEKIPIAIINSGHLPFITNQQEFYQHINNQLCQEKTA